jgi:hypothetical protein
MVNLALENEGPSNKPVFPVETTTYTLLIALNASAENDDLFMKTVRVTHRTNSPPRA